jgi:hypothetical protein
MIRQRQLSFPAVLLFICLTLSGCGDSNVFSSLADDDTPAARLDQGLAAINAGDYETAIATLEGLDQDDPAVRRYLASAYAGRAGFDAIELIDILSRDDADYSGSDGSAEQKMFDTLAAMFGADAEGRIPELAGRITDLGNALALLTDDGRADEEGRFQAGLYGSVQTVLLTADLLDGAGIDRIKNLSDTEISDLVAANFDRPVSAGDATPKGEALNASLLLVADASAGLKLGLEPGDSNDMADEMDELLNELGYDDDGRVDQTELIDYLRNL